MVTDRSRLVLWLSLIPTGLLVVFVFAMTERHNNQLQAQAEAHNAQLLAATAAHNAQLVRMAEEHNAQLAAAQKRR